VAAILIAHAPDQSLVQGPILMGSEGTVVQSIKVIQLQILGQVQIHEAGVGIQCRILSPSWPRDTTETKIQIAAQETQIIVFKACDLRHINPDSLCILPQALPWGEKRTVSVTPVGTESQYTHSAVFERFDFGLSDARGRQ
jgi:hypothetical protein